METEIWKDVVGYDGIYKVSNFGIVKSYKFGKHRFLKPQKDRYGYLRVSFSKNKSIKHYYIHKLVAIYFLNHTKVSDLVIDHIDHDKNNNKVYNLRLITQRLNSSHLNGKLSGKYSSIYTGVSWINTRKRWMATIRIKGKNKNLGLFLSEIDAAKAYQDQLLKIK